MGVRTLPTDVIINTIKEMCIQANLCLGEDMQQALLAAKGNEESKLGQIVLEQLKKNLEIAEEETIPICQDTGMAIVFLEIGQDVHISGMQIRMR